MKRAFFFKSKVTILSIFTVLLFSTIAGWALLHKGLPPTHDGEYHVVRFYEFTKALSDGNLYPRWAPDLNNGYGVPLFNYVYPLPNYVASIFHFAGFSFIDAFKLEMFVGLLLGAIFFYLWSREFWGNLGAVVSSIFYTFSPYHFVDIYIRGSVGEVWALTFFPAVLWSLTRFIKYEDKKFFILSAVFLSLVIFSHNILALMFIFFAIAYAVFFIYQRKNNRKDLLVKTFFIVIIGLGLSSVFWLPALLEEKFVRGLQVFDISANFPAFYQLIFPSWGSGFSAGDIQNQMSFQIGVANLLAVSLSFIIALSMILKKNKNSRLLMFFVLWFFLDIFLMLKVSLPVWKQVPFMNYFQFPWRFLSLEIVVASFLAGSIVYFWKSKILAIILILIVFFLGIDYMKPAYYLYRNDKYYFTRPNFINGTNSPGNVFNTIWMNSSLLKQKEKIVLPEGKGEIKGINTKSTVYNFTVDVEEKLTAIVNTAYFPGWIASIDNKQEKIKNSNGLISFVIPSGTHMVKLNFADTSIRKLSNLISLFTALLIFFLSFRALFIRIKK